MLDKILAYFQYPFVTYALIAAVFIALCSAIYGVVIVLKRFSFIGDGLSHIAFGAIALAAIMDITDNSILVLICTGVAAVMLLKRGEKSKIQGDAMVAMSSIGALAVGYLLLNVFSTSSNVSGDVCSSLFGSTSMVTLTKKEVIICAITCTLAIALFFIFYNRLFSVTFDESFARATGIRANIYNLFLAIIIAVVIVLGKTLVGSLLISALVIFPALSSMRLFKSFRSVIISSAIISVLCAVFGIIISLLLATPVGATIVVANLVVFVLFFIIGKLCR